MKRLFTVIFLFLTLNIVAQIDTYDYLKKCDVEYKILLREISKSEANKWDDKLSKINEQYIKIGEKKELEEQTYKDLKAEGIYAIQYLNIINNFLLPRKTNLVNSLADQVILQKIETKVKIKLDSLDNKFKKYANTNNANKFKNLYSHYLNKKNEYETLKLKKDTSFFAIHEFKSNVYADTDSVKTYVVYNWKNQILKLHILNNSLDQIKNDIESKQYLIVRDPNPIFPLLFQICTLVVIIANSFINFQFDPKLFKIILLIVGISLITSLILLIISEETFLNIAINIFAPGFTYLAYFLYQKKKN